MPHNPGDFAAELAGDYRAELGMKKRGQKKALPPPPIAAGEGGDELSAIPPPSPEGELEKAELTTEEQVVVDDFASEFDLDGSEARRMFDFLWDRYQGMKPGAEMAGVEGEEELV